MRATLWLPFSCAVAFLINGCANKDGSTGNDSLGTGPFDSRGNYREEWANDPSKWRKPGSRTAPSSGDESVPVIAKNEEPPPNANPLATAGSYNPKNRPAGLNPVSRETAHVSPEPKSKRTGSTPKVVKVRPVAEPEIVRTTDEPKLAKTHGKPKTKVAKVHDDSKPKIVKTKPRTKSKSKSGGRYIVKSGDSLSRIATRNHSSVEAIQKANGITGTLIHPGDKLIVP
jgi:LysM repeat protein